jgi:electron transfer flavoprotein beta subunit
MKIVVVLRQVPDLIEPLEITSEETALDYDEAGFLVNESDDHALEQALLLGESDGADITVLAFDFGDVETTLFAAAAKGVDRIVTIPWEDPVPPATDVAATMLAETIRSLEPDCVMIGCQAHDELEGALGPRLAIELDRPYLGVIRGVSKSSEEGVLHAYKEFPGAAKAKMAVRLPAVLGILAADQPPRYVPVSRIRAAMKSAEFDEAETEPIQSSSAATVCRLYFPPKGEGARMLEGSEKEVAEQIADILVEKGVLT